MSALSHDSQDMGTPSGVLVLHWLPASEVWALVSSGTVAFCAATLDEVTAWASAHGVRRDVVGHDGVPYATARILAHAQAIDDMSWPVGS